MNTQLIGDVSAQATQRMTGNSRLEFSEKFAELIVRECAGVELYWLSEQDRRAVTEKIKQHFGVAE